MEFRLRPLGFMKFFFHLNCLMIGVLQKKLKSKFHELYIYIYYNKKYF